MTTTEVPSPRLVAAQMRLGILAAESVWAAHWLVQGFDGEAVVELAGLSGRDTRSVADLLPAALEEVGIPPMTSLQAEVKVAFDHIAALHIQGRASWRWVMETVRETISQGGYVFEFFDEPLAAVYGFDDELGAAWVVPNVSWPETCCGPASSNWAENARSSAMSVKVERAR